MTKLLEILGGIAILIFLLSGGEMLEAVVSYCPPLLIFVFAIILISESGCLQNIGGILLIPIGIIALIIWFLL